LALFRLISEPFSRITNLNNSVRSFWATLFLVSVEYSTLEYLIRSSNEFSNRKKLDSHSPNVDGTQQLVVGSRAFCCKTILRSRTCCIKICM